MTGRRSYDIRLPMRPFFYTIDQVATLTGLTLNQVNRLLFRHGADSGIPPRERLYAINLAPADAPIEWRVEEKELLRWLKHRGIAVLHRY